MAMRVRFTTSCVVITGESYSQNQVVEIEDTLATALITGGVAVELDATAPEGFLLGANTISTTTTTKTNNGKAKGKAAATAE